MPRIALTERRVRALKAPDPSGKQVLHWDTKLRGFGVLCSGVTNAKTYVVQRELPGRKTRRVTIAPVNLIPLGKAREEATAKLLGMASGIDPKAKAPQSVTLRQALAAYLERRKNLRPMTRRNYQNVFDYHLAGWADLPLREITPQMVGERHRAIQEEIAAGGRYRGEGMANFAMVVLRVLYNFAAENDKGLPPNPTAVLRKGWYEIKPRERYVRKEQMPAFYRAVLGLESPVTRDFLLLLLFTGLRRSEAAGLRWEEVEPLRERVITIPGERTKGKRKLELPMTGYVHDLLVVRRALGRDRFVFPANSRSGHIETDGLADVAEACGVRVSAHDLRRTFITYASKCKIPWMALKMLVNHATKGDVTAGYSQWDVEDLREPAQRVCDYLKELCEVEPLPEGVARLPA
jgi:integrase